MSESFVRAFALDDMAIRAGGEGRTIEAYVAMFDAPYEVTDEQGHYEEIIVRSAFDKTLKENADRVSVLFNHGLDRTHKPVPDWQMPIGVPLEITPDSRGLRTVTRISRTPLGDQVLELIKDGAIRGMSFGGLWVRSKPDRSGFRELPTIYRQEIALRDYGPTERPVNRLAQILAVRSEALMERIEQLSDDQRKELADLIASYGTRPPADLEDEDTEQDAPPDGIDTQDEDAASHEAPPAGPSLYEVEQHLRHLKSQHTKEKNHA